MVFDLSEITGIGAYTKKVEKDRTLYFKNEQAFLVVNHNTIEVRCDHKLIELLTAKYESIMKSRYFGSGGLEIVLAHQLSDAEIHDLIRLSYNLT